MVRLGIVFWLAAWPGFADQRDKLCSLEGQLVSVLYQMRLTGADMVTMLDGESDQVRRSLIMAAFEAPSSSLPNVQESVVGDLVTAAELACYKRTK